ncbi:MAG: flagellar basal body L-ring protein FlgH [Planctomycetota bacterium]|jgi:flagellar L-ring protein precursor FlgH
MNKKIIFGLILISFLLVLANCSQAGSIWAKRSKDVRVMYADDTARQIGDILTIIITEKSKVDNKAKRDLKKETKRSTTFNGQLGIDHILPSIPGFTMEAESSDELKGKADFKDERSFIDFMTVVVVDILPNGNLVVMGTRTRNIAGDTQTIEASGIVRPSDISFNNTVKSEKVADFHIVSRNSGVAEPYNRQGWLGRIFDILWPF